MSKKELTTIQQLYVDACRFIILQSTLQKKLLNDKKQARQMLNELLGDG